MDLPRIRHVTALDLPVKPWDWPFAQIRRAEIDAHFAEQQRARPRIWNGRVLLARNLRFSGACFAADYFETDFASFLAWRDWGFPDKDVFNCPGMGALRASDGAILLGEMGPHTANAGRIYFAAGTPDLHDVRDGKVDLSGSVERETKEEMGLATDDYRASPDWCCVDARPLIALVRTLQSDLPGEALRAKVEANLARQSQPEFSAVHLVRGTADVSDAMPRFVTDWLEAQFLA